jgi:HKD family nuclease
MGPSIQINSNLNYPIGKIINQELQNSVETQIAVAFLKKSGIKAIEESLLMSLDKGAKFELIVGLDFKTTDPFAMKYFIDLKKKYKDVSFYCYGDKGDNRNDIVFHPKIYMFRSPKEVTSIIGSTNLTQGGLMSNFEVNTIFNEVKPIYYTQLQAIYNSVKFTDSLFVPDEEYLQNYSDVFKAFEKNEEKAKVDNGIKEKIEAMSEKETKLPGTIPSIRSMLISYLKEQHEKGVEKVFITDIYSYLDERIKDPIFVGRFKLDTFHNSIRGEINHNEVEAKGNSLKLYKRVSKGYYILTTEGEKYYGR